MPTLNYSLPYADNPYGATIYSNAPDNTDLLKSQALTDLSSLGMRWLRWQLSLSKLDNPQGTYTWTNLDTTVAACNAAGINLCFPLQDPPTWGQYASSCGSQMPLASYIQSMATMIATRYNGVTINGITGKPYGTLQSIEIGNEEYTSNSITACRDASQYITILADCYTALRAAGHKGLIGCAAQLQQSLAALQAWTQAIYSAGLAYDLDYFNIHYYTSGGVPPSYADGTANTLSLDQIWGAVHQIIAANGDNKPIWITEFGYPTNANGQLDGSASLVDPMTQAEYLVYELESCRKSSGAVQKAFIYTMDTYGANTDGKSITQGITPSETYLPAYYAIQREIQTYPQWNTPGQIGYSEPGQSITVTFGTGAGAAGITVYQFDTLPLVTVQLVDAGRKAIDLTGLSSLNLAMRIQAVSGGGVKSGAGYWNIINAKQGLAQYRWGYNDVSVAGSWNFVVRVDFPSGSVHSDPNSFTIVASY